MNFGISASNTISTSVNSSGWLLVLLIDLMTVLSKAHVFPPRSWSSCNSSTKNGAGSEEADR